MDAQLDDDNFPKGCLFRFLTDLATKIEKRQRQNLPKFS
jgi:hypothetical protein